MGSAIVARLGLDSGQFRRDLVASSQAANQVSSQMARGSQARAQAADSVWKADKKVRAEMVGMARDLAMAGSVSDMLAGSMEHLAGAMKLPLAAGIAAGAGFIMVDQLQQAAERAETLRKNLAEAVSEAKNLSKVDGASALSQGVTRVAERIKELQKEASGMAYLWDKFNEGLEDMGGEGDSVATQKAKQVAEAKAEIHRMIQGIASAESRVAEIQELTKKGSEEEAALAKLRLDFEQKIAAARREMKKAGASDDDVGDVTNQLRRQQRNEEDQVRAGFSKRREEEAQKLKQTQMEAISATADEEAKVAMEALRNDQKNAEALADREADLQEKQIEELRDFEAQQYHEWLLQKDRLNKEAEQKRMAEIDAATTKRVEAEKQVANARDQLVNAKMQDIKDPGGRVDRRRAARDADSLSRRAAREADLELRGGKSVADATKDTRPISERLKPKEEFGPKEGLLERESRLRRQRAEPKVNGEKTGQSDDVKAALDACQMAKDMATVAKNLKPGKI